MVHVTTAAGVLALSLIAPAQAAMRGLAWATDNRWSTQIGSKPKIQWYHRQSLLHLILRPSLTPPPLSLQHRLARRPHLTTRLQRIRSSILGPRQMVTVELARVRDECEEAAAPYGVQ
jgi:hypothetical protein